MLRNLNAFKTLAVSPEDTRIEQHMKAGTDLRRILKRSDALALLAIASIKERRTKISANKHNTPMRSTAFILRSLKRQEELDTLRKVYGSSLFIVSCYAPRDKRVNTLAAFIAKSHHDFNEQHYKEVAEHLINIDQHEEEESFGQRVVNVFPLADFFVTDSTMKNVSDSLKRFVEMIFGYPFHTPSKDEFGMFQARAVALQSSDLSRQVGAAVLTKHNDLLAVGCNEVPKAHGGLYWATDNDHRDFQKGYDPSTKIKNEILAEILQRLKNASWLKEDFSGIQPHEILDTIVNGELEEKMKGAQVLQLLEFGRIVHAEMAALMDATRRGVSVLGCTLYCTTFPCHMCARHIVAAGISEVVYIEPYPKSMASRLYSDSIRVDSDEISNNFINFRSFQGVSPRRYLELFDMPQRKTKLGDVVRWHPGDAKPRIKLYELSYLSMETNLVLFLQTQLKQNNVS